MSTSLRKILLWPLCKSLPSHAGCSVHRPCLFGRTTGILPSVSPLFLLFPLHSHVLRLYWVISSAQHSTDIQNSNYCERAGAILSAIFKDGNFSIRTQNFTERTLSFNTYWESYEVPGNFLGSRSFSFSLFIYICSGKKKSSSTCVLGKSSTSPALRGIYEVIFLLVLLCCNASIWNHTHIKASKWL